MYRKLIYLLSILIFCHLNIFNNYQKQPFVMIDPAGHSKNVGRRLVESFERGETFKFAERLKEELISKYHVRPILTRFPGEEIVDLQNASFANRLQVDFYISLHIYRQLSAKPKLFLYYLVYDPIVDLAKRAVDHLSFIPVQNAHFASIKTTIFYCNKIKEVMLNPLYQKKLDFYGPFGIPFKPLVGIVAPAVGIEVGIDQEDKWQSLVYPIVDSLSFLSQNTHF